MHPFSVLTLAIFVAGYITARWDLVTRLYELAVFAWDHGVVVSDLGDLSLSVIDVGKQARTAKGFAILSLFFFLFIIPVERLASRETDLVRLYDSVTLAVANICIASTLWKCRNFCKGTTATPRLLLGTARTEQGCHARA